MVYTYYSFAYFRKRKVVALNLCLFAVHFLGFFLLFLSTGNENLIFLYGAGLVYLILVENLFHLAYPEGSKILTSYICMLLVFGSIMLARLSIAKAYRQFLILVVGTILVSVIPYIMKKWKALRKFAWVYGIAGVVLLLVVLILGENSNGAKLSIRIFGISFQPSEFIKISYVFFIAAMFEVRNDLKQVLKTGILAAMHILILVACKDLGSALVFSLVFVLMVYAATKKPIYLFAGLIVGSAASCVAYHFFSHVQTRVTAWLDPWSVIETKGYQIAQSLFAIGTGGWLGMGLNEGSPYQIPVVEEDFIFSAIAEELGGLVAICVIFICLGCLLLILNIALQMHSNFYRYMALGLACEYGIQVFLTIAGAIKMIPSTGITLPFVSYGGSSLLSSLAMYGIIQGLYISEADEIRGKEEEKVSPLKNRELYLILYLFIGMFAMMPCYLAYFLIGESREIIDNPYNLRQEKFSQKVIRGTILTGDGEIIAKTETEEDGTENRIYPFHELFSHVVGYSQSGKDGLEKVYNFQLLRSDVPFYEKIINGFQGRKDDGNQLVTTLNYKLQKAASDALDGKKGAVVVIEPSTGKILAMVSKPDYDPNQIEEIWNSLSKDSESKEQSYLLNRATQGLYPPGSTFKILTALEYLREYPDQIASFSYDCDGSYEYEEFSIHCYHKNAHGTISFETAFAKSCNGAFASIGTQLSKSRFTSLCEDFLYNRDLPLALSYVSSQFELSDSSSIWDVLQTSIGQGAVEVTPLHQAMIVATIANDGVMMKPYLVDSITDAHKGLVKKYKPQSYLSPMSAEEAEKLTEWMVNCVTDGTGHNAGSDDYSVAGKTGTAEWSTSKEAHSWFVGFAPTENPQIALSVIVEEGGAGSKEAATIAGEIFEAWNLMEEQE